MNRGRSGAMDFSFRVAQPLGERSGVHGVRPSAAPDPIPASVNAARSGCRGDHPAPPTGEVEARRDQGHSATLGMRDREVSGLTGVDASGQDQRHVPARGVGEAAQLLRMGRIAGIGASGVDQHRPAIAPLRQGAGEADRVARHQQRHPQSRVKAASCSVAPARFPSVVMTMGTTPPITSLVARRTVVRVFPAPGGPVRSTGGSCGPNGRVRERQDAGDRFLQIAAGEFGMQIGGTPCHARAARRAGSGAIGSGSTSAPAPR